MLQVATRKVFVTVVTNMSKVITKSYISIFYCQTAKTQNKSENKPFLRHGQSNSHETAVRRGSKVYIVTSIHLKPTLQSRLDLRSLIQKVNHDRNVE